MIQKSPCSYPTYEEWKQIKGRKKYVKGWFRSYPTYEEWKQVILDEDGKVDIGSYPTYEEWKH